MVEWAQYALEEARHKVPVLEPHILLVVHNLAAVHSLVVEEVVGRTVVAEGRHIAAVGIDPGGERHMEAVEVVDIHPAVADMVCAQGCRLAVAVEVDIRLVVVVDTDSGKARHMEVVVEEGTLAGRNLVEVVVLVVEGNRPGPRGVVLVVVDNLPVLLEVGTGPVEVAHNLLY